MKVRFKDVHYNARAGAFEARVDIVRGAQTFRYPCRLAGPITMDAGAVRAGLYSKALKMSDSH
ncbi:MAG: orotidine 5'-phosphate decarboxylase [Pseudomonadota bacterium]